LVALLDPKIYFFCGRESLTLKRKNKFPVWELNKQWCEIKKRKFAEALEKKEECSSSLLEVNKQIHSIQSKISRKNGLVGIFLLFFNFSLNNINAKLSYADLYLLYWHTVGCYFNQMLNVPEPLFLYFTFWLL
jgi:hypothetical protein